MAADEGKDDPIDIDLVRKLADLLSETGLTEIEVERAGLRVKVARGLSISDIESIPALHAPAQPALLSGPAPQPAAAPRAEPKGEVVKSPLVGTVYLQANPGADPFVRVGEQVSAGQTLMIVEAMKTMNPIPAPRAGRVLELLVDDGEPVEFGEPLVVLE
ncbi:MAG: acetyl-CoA carboxylase biotin carboxyl carrier protein [Caulobacteraceae bacterium]